MEINEPRKPFDWLPLVAVLAALACIVLAAFGGC